jgi:hypothetical protein
MGVFDFFRKKTPGYDSTNIRIQDLDVGFVFEYDLSTWEVRDVYEYDWGDNYFTQEYQISNGTETKYLSVEEDDELELSIMDKIKVNSVNEKLLQHLIDYQKPPKSIVFNGIKFHLENESPGYFNHVTKGDEWEEFRCWNFEDDEGKNMLCIEQWDEKEFEASVGTRIKEFEISNILPSENRK